MAVKKKNQPVQLELYVSWMLGCLLLLISNRTIFKSHEASIGEPWLNLTLSAVILALLFKIGQAFRLMQRESRLSASNIQSLDRMQQEDFARYMGQAFRRSGWAVEELEAGAAEAPEAPGAAFDMHLNGRLVRCLIRSSRRKLTHVTVKQAAGWRSDRNGADMEVWLITNGSFTAQARREAAACGVKVWQRDDLIDFLVKLDASYALKTSV